jgi:protease-4
MISSSALSSRRFVTNSLLAALTLLSSCHCDVKWGTSGDRADGEGSEGDSKGSWSNRRSPPGLYEVDLSRGLRVEEGSWFQAPSKAGLTDWVETMRRLSRREAPKGVFVRLGGGTFSLARAVEAGDLLAAWRKSGVPVFCHADEYNSATLAFAATACEKTWLSEAGGVETPVIAAETVHAKDLLDKLSVDAEILQVGKYKGANESVMRSELSPEARESLQQALGGVRDSLRASITAGRMPAAFKTDLLESGMYSATKAKSLGFVDELGSPDEARKALRERTGLETLKKVFGSSARDGFGQLLAEFFSSSWEPEDDTPVVVVMDLNGPIGLSGRGIAARPLIRKLQKLATYDAVKGIVIRMDSPGGSALASDLVWKELYALREKKHVVVSVGGMAASGGYYIASAADRIYADSSSIVGSIGVVGGKMSFGRALGAIGVQSSTVTATGDASTAQRATLHSAFHPWDAASRAQVQETMEAVYQLFLRRIAAGRSLGEAEVATFAEGRLFAGDQAKKLRMVDELGGLADAIAATVKETGVAERSVHFLTDVQGLDALFDDQDADAEGAGPAELLRKAVSQAAMAQILAATFPNLLTEGRDMGAGIAAAEAALVSWSPMLSEGKAVALPMLVVLP